MTRRFALVSASFLLSPAASRPRSAAPATPSPARTSCRSSPRARRSRWASSRRRRWPAVDRVLRGSRGAGLRLRASAADGQGHRERPNLPWEFHVVNDASVNAFALPGGFIFVTRGLMTSINNEAELATVIGPRDRARDQPPLGPADQQGAGGAARPRRRQHPLVRRGPGGRASPARGSASCSSSTAATPRTRPTWPGFRYALNQNYDVREMANVFQTLDRVSSAGGGGRLPEWLATHPNPGSRIQNTQQRLDTLHKDLSQHDHQPRRVPGSRIRNMTYGEDPRQGFFEGGTFYHPDLRFQLDVPAGVEDPEHGRSRRGREPAAGRDHPARPGREDAPAAGGAAVPVAAGDQGGQHARPPASTGCRRRRATSRRRPSRGRSRGW